MIKTAVILTVFNRREVTLKGLRTLYKAIEYLQKEKPNEGYRFDIYMTDDGSTDGTADAVIGEFPDVHIIQGCGSLYWSGGMRKAWQAAIDSGVKYDFYLWYNDDAELYENALVVMFSVFASQKRKGIVVGSMCDGQKIREVTYGGRDYHKHIISPKDDEAIECDTFNGNLVLISKDAYMVLGLINIRFRHSLGDFDYGYRAKAKSIQILIAPQYQGICNRHERPPMWCDSRRPIVERIRNYYSPLGNSPKEIFYFEKTHFGVKTAFLHLLSNHIRLLFPYLWKEV